MSNSKSKSRRRSSANRPQSKGDSRPEVLAKSTPPPDLPQDVETQLGREFEAAKTKKRVEADKQRQKELEALRELALFD